MDTTSVDVATTHDGNGTFTVEPADSQMDASSYTTDSNGVWESVRRPLPPRRTHGWNEWVF